MYCWLLLVVFFFLNVHLDRFFENERRFVNLLNGSGQFSCRSLVGQDNQVGAVVLFRLLKKRGDRNAVVSEDSGCLGEYTRMILNEKP